MSENQNNAPLAHLRHALEMGQQECSKEVLRGNGKAKNEESGHPTKPGPIGNASAPPLTIWQRQIEHLKERVSGLVRAENRAKEQRLLWHGKHAIVATENNALRKRLAKMTVELHRLQRHVEELSAYRAGRASGGESGPFNAYLDGYDVGRNEARAVLPGEEREPESLRENCRKCQRSLLRAELDVDDLCEDCRGLRQC